MNSLFRFPHRVRIHVGECGAVARALHHKAKINSLPAVSENVLLTTNERKSMSTKTNFKRLALGVIAALGLGMLSVAPSQAVITGLTVTGANGTSTLTGTGFRSDSTTAAVVTVNALLDSAKDSITVTFVQKTVPTGSAANARLYFNETTTPTGSTAVETTTAVGATGQAATAYLAASDSHVGIVKDGGGSDIFKIKGGVGYVGAKFMLQLDSTTTRIKGTYTYTVIVKQFNADDSTPLVADATTTQDVSIVIADTAANIALTGATAIDPAKTTAVMNAGAPTTLSAVDSAVAVVATASATNHATIQVKTYTADSNPAPESVTVTVTGPGVVTTSDGSIAGKSLTVVGTGGDTTFRIRADGTAGVASIVVKTTTVTFPAKNVTFYAKAASTLVATVNQPVINTGSVDDVIRVTAKDADGNIWAGTAYIYASSAADALIAGSTTPVACTFNTATSVHRCPVTGTAKGTANLKVIDAATVALATATSNEVSTRVSTGVATTAKLSFDKATYAPGEKAQLRVQILDEAGLAMPSKTVTAAFTAAIATTKDFSANSASLSSSADVVLQGATSSTSNTNAGYQTYVVYMPMSNGVITISATGSTGLALSGRVAISASATVTNDDPAITAATAAAEAAGDAAAEAIDAANAATDAANLAAEAADAATVAAEEARDAADAATAAVEELATQVATLMAALKAQITTLANTVAKIAKKVKA